MKRFLAVLLTLLIMVSGMQVFAAEKIQGGPNLFNKNGNVGFENDSPGKMPTGYSMSDISKYDKVRSDNTMARTGDISARTEINTPKDYMASLRAGSAIGGIEGSIKIGKEYEVSVWINTGDAPAKDGDGYSLRVQYHNASGEVKNAYSATG